MQQKNIYNCGISSDFVKKSTQSFHAKFLNNQKLNFEKPEFAITFNCD